MIMKRREYLRIMGGAAAVTAIAPNYGFGKSSFFKDGVLVEAASFSNPGGWVLDTQFYQQMGGCYLLAHGMGKPVANASTEVAVPQKGQWYVFVRTKDWCPGEWDAPGRFKMSLNGETLKTTVGTQAGWTWQPGGRVSLPEGKVKIELHDLTGFDGRVDAIYLSPVPNPSLPVETKEVMGWKDELSGRSKLTVKSENYDLVIVGGGMSGCAAALAADAKGLKVALIQDRPVFGGNASDEVRVHTLGIKGKSAKLIGEIDTIHWPNGSARAIADQKKREATMAASSVHLFLNHLAIGLAKEGDKISSVEARDSRTGIIRRFNAPVFIDASGDGWLGFWGGAEFRYGREASSEFNEGWPKHGDLWSPKVADNRVMGTSLLWNSEAGSTASSFPKVPWAMPVARQASAVKGEWFWEYSDNELHQIDDAEQIRDHNLRAIYGNFYNAKQKPKHAKTALKFVGYIGGRRESRRIMGDYIYTMKDVMELRTFPDTVVEEKRAIDCHYQLKEIGDPADYLSEALFKKPGKLYYLPFRSLYSKDIPNLMMAGRCFSCSHVGLGGPRVMNTCAQMGVATGYAAVLCKKHGTTPRVVGQTHIKKLRAMIGYTS